MRGYERQRLQAPTARFGFRIPMRGYEAPPSRTTATAFPFRIPMRGYEMTVPSSGAGVDYVPNPHEGL